MFPLNDARPGFWTQPEWITWWKTAKENQNNEERWGEAPQAALGPTATSHDSLCPSLAPASLEGLELLRQDELAAAVNVVHHLLLEQRQLVPQHVGGGHQLRVLALEVLDSVLEPGDPLQLPLPALGRGHPVPHALPLRLDALLSLHVDGGERRRVAGHLGHRLRLLLERV